MQLWRRLQSIQAFDYLWFNSKQGLVVENGGAWTCQGFDGSCTQSLVNNDYGPITATSVPRTSSDGLRSPFMSLYTTITLADDEFKGATSMSFTISFNVQASAQGGSPNPITLQSTVGGVLYTFPVSVQYNSTSPVSATHSGSLGAPTKFNILAQAAVYDGNFNGATVTAVFSDIKFVIHDVVYGATSMAGSSSLLALSTLSSLPTSDSGSISTSSTTNGTFLLRSSSAISGNQTFIGTMLPEPSNSENQSHTATPPNSSGSSSTNANERAGVIAGSLVGLGLILITIAFWYRWWRRRRIVRSAQAFYGDRQSEIDADCRRVNQEPWIPRPYCKRPYSRPSTGNGVIPPIEDERVESTELEGQEAFIPSQRRRDRNTVQQSTLPPPAYSQLSSRPASSSIVSSNGN